MSIYTTTEPESDEHLVRDPLADPSLAGQPPTDGLPLPIDPAGLRAEVAGVTWELAGTQADDRLDVYPVAHGSAGQWAARAVMAALFAGLIVLVFMRIVGGMAP